jgi:murein DD-endopeptidase MepM/ murein hydrolase activator NlpD
MKMLRTFIILAVIGLVGLFGYYFFHNLFPTSRSLKLRQWLADPAAHADWTISAGERCGDAPFQMPTNGMIGYLWGDSFKLSHSHQGIDIFGGTEAGLTAVYAAYDGYLTRLESWKSSLIIRIPKDPLQPDRQIWTYYTHMADEKGDSCISGLFPPGTNEVFVKAGTLLGYQGNYSGTPNHPVGVHLHFSIVKDNGSGGFLNELEIKNTLDPSPYFGLELDGKSNRDEIPVCPVSGNP